MRVRQNGPFEPLRDTVTRRPLPAAPGTGDVTSEHPPRPHTPNTGRAGVP